MIAIVGACGSNFASVQFALARLGKASVITTDKAEIQAASQVILPGVGTAHQAMAQLQRLDLIEALKQLRQPVLGICLGMQILFAHSEEGGVAGLGLMPEKVKALSPKPGYSLPHMGWNKIKLLKADSPLLHGVPEGSYMYFVHGYAAPVADYTLASTEYTEAFSAMVQYQNFYGTQFHPERSGAVGAQILKNFVELT